MPYTKLISTAELARHLTDPNWAIVDCRFSLNDATRGRRDYQRAHISGAVYGHLDEDLSGSVIRGKTGRHPLPEVDAIAQTFSDWGIDATVQVVAYDDLGGALAAARLWWLLRWLGHDAVAVLDGGWPRWHAEGRPVHSGYETRARRVFVPDPRLTMLVTTDDVLASLHEPNFRLFDARTADRYRGENETIDPVAGHIPGARSAPYPDNLGPDGLFLSPENLRVRYAALLGDVPPDHAAFYCGSGVTAAQDVLAMTHAGLVGSRLYAGSWSEWIADPTRPIKTGRENS